MKNRLQEFSKDLALFFADLTGLGNRETIRKTIVGIGRDIRQDRYHKIPLLLTVMVHLGVLLFAIAAPFILTAKNPRLPEVYTVKLYSVPEAAPPPVTRVVKVTTPAPKKTVAPEPVKKDAVSLSPIRQQLEKESREKEARKRQQELQARKIEQVKLDLLKDQAENEAIRAEKDLDLAKKEAAAKIADLYKTTDYDSRDRRKTTADSTATSSSRGESDLQKLEALDSYRARLFEHISPHWQLPELQEWDENLRATIVMQVNRDGTVTNSYFEKRSKNQLFDQYVEKAIDNAQPLPPFPLDFHEKSEEIAVTFSPGGLL